MLRPSGAASVLGTYTYDTVQFTASGNTSFQYQALQAGFGISTVTNTQASINTVCGADANCQTFYCNNACANPGDATASASTSVFQELDGTVTSQAITRGVDSFLVIEATPVTCTSPTTCTPRTGDDQTLLFATGSVSGKASAVNFPTGNVSATLDQFTVSATLDGSPAAGRDFLRPQTLLGIAPSSLLSSNLEVFNPACLFHDHHLALTRVAVRFCRQWRGGRAGIDHLGDAGPAHLRSDAGWRAAQRAHRRFEPRGGCFGEHLESTLQHCNRRWQSDAGRYRSGWIHVSAELRFGKFTCGWLETPIAGGGTPTNFASWRFAQVLPCGAGVTSSCGTSAAAARNDLSLSGYLAGLVQVSGGSGAVQVVPLLSTIGADGSPNGFRLVASSSQGSAGAALTATAGVLPVSVSLGSLGNGLSAYPNPGEYAAEALPTPDLSAGPIANATGANSALISGAPLLATSGTSATSGWTATLDPALRAQLAGGYRYLQWGFFFGDLTAQSTTTHANLAGWIAGVPTPEGHPCRRARPATAVMYSRTSPTEHSSTRPSVRSPIAGTSAIGSEAARWHWTARPIRCSHVCSACRWWVPALHPAAPPAFRD